MTLPISIIRCVLLCMCYVHRCDGLQILFWLQRNLVSDVAASNLHNGQQHNGPRSATWIQDSDIFFKTKQVPSVVGTLGVANSNAMQHNLHQHDINNVCHCKIRWFVEILCCLLGFCRIRRGSNVILYLQLFVCLPLFVSSTSKGYMMWYMCQQRWWDVIVIRFWF